MSQKYHFIGIGGSGMGPLASLMVSQGFSVSGSDVRENEVTADLKKSGVEIFVGHDANHVREVDYVVISSAIDEANPELTVAREKKIPVLKRAELLAQLMNKQSGIAIAGAHGKTTTSAMVSHLLIQAGLEPTTMVGGFIAGDSYNAILGSGQYFVAEVDESDGSFLLTKPKYAIVTNIDREHMDYYQNWDNLVNAYEQFMMQIDTNGVLIIYGGDKTLCQLAEKSQCRTITYGLSDQCEVYAKDIKYKDFKTQFKCVFADGSEAGDIELDVPGEHNVINTLGCIALGKLLSIDFSVMRKAMRKFRNVRRRFQLKGKVGDVWIVDDYGHHPTEIEATIKTAKLIKRNRLVTIFQPHRYSRTQLLMKELVKALTLSENVIVTDIYEASENAIEGVSSQAMFEEIKKVHTGHIVYLSKEKIIKYLVDFLQPGDLVLTLGAGDINIVADKLMRSLKESAAGSRK